LFTDPVVEATKPELVVSYPVRVAFRPVDGRWQAPETLAHTGYFSSLVVGLRGEAIVVWEALTGIVKEAERPAGESWLSSKAVLSPGGEEPEVAVDAKGDVLIASNLQAPGQSGGIVVTQRPAGGAFSASRKISGNENAFKPNAAMNASGDAIVAWAHESDQSCWVRAAYYSAGGGWSSPSTVSGPTTVCEVAPQVSIDAAGRARVMWWSEQSRGAESLEEATRTADGGWRSQKLETRATPQRFGFHQVTDARGDKVVAWSQNGHEWVRVRPAGQRWLPATMLSNRRALLASLALSSTGDVLLVWGQPRQIVAATKSLTGKTWRLSTVAKTKRSKDPIAEFAPNGDGVVSWLNNRNNTLSTAWSTSPID
jgi:hypothetical protein